MGNNKNKKAVKIKVKKPEALLALPLDLSKGINENYDFNADIYVGEMIKYILYLIPEYNII